MRRRQGTLEAVPPDLLGVIASPERLQGIDPRILPLEVRPTPAAGFAMLRRFDDRQRLLGPTGRQKPLPDLGGDFGNPTGLFIVLGNEGIDVPLGVGDVLQGQIDGAPPGMLGHLVFVDRTAWSIADGAPFILGRPPNRLVGKRGHALF